MGKRRAKALLAKLKANQQQELENTAAVFTVAQVAVNELRETECEGQAASRQALLPPVAITRTDLEERYGGYRQCRSAAKAMGICFSCTPTWERLVLAFNQAEILQRVVDRYREAEGMSGLPGVSIRIDL